MVDRTTNQSDTRMNKSNERSEERTESPAGRFDRDREGFANHPHFEVRTDTAAIGDLPSTPQGATRNDQVGRFDRARHSINRNLNRMRNSDVINRVNTSARTNPWVHVGLVGVGGLILGYVLGKSTLSSVPRDERYVDASEDIEDDVE